MAEIEGAAVDLNGQRWYDTRPMTDRDLALNAFALRRRMLRLIHDARHILSLGICKPACKICAKGAEHGFHVLR